MAYIDTQYLGKCETCRHHRSGRCNTFCDCGEEYSPDLSKIPTEDVVEVVRCKDCIFYQANSCFNRQWDFESSTEIPLVRENDYCSYGERTPQKEG